MIVLDTNVISELMRPTSHPKVVAWISSQSRASLYTTSINRAEILRGLAALPAGRRRTLLEKAASDMFSEDFAGRVLAFDERASEHYARIAIARRDAGKPIDGFDALIAATASAAGCRIATRDVSGFEGCNLEIINPWEA